MVKYAPKRNNSRKNKNTGLSFEKKILLQTIVSASIFVYCIIVSNTETATIQKEYIHKAVNISDTKNDIKNMIIDLYNGTKNSINKMEAVITNASEKENDVFPKNPGSRNIALAQPAIYPQMPEQKIQETTPDPESVTESLQPNKPTFRMPLEGRITSPYGERIHPVGNNHSVHYGIDIAGNHGDCVISCLPGTVTETGFDNGLGYYVKIGHEDNLVTVYGHLSEILVKKGEIVDDNTRIGSVGSTGVATGPHLHFETRVDGNCVNPSQYFGDL